MLLQGTILLFYLYAILFFLWSDGQMKLIQLSLIAQLQLGQSPEITRLHQGSCFGKFQRTASLQKVSHKLGAEIMILPLVSQIQFAEQNA